METKKEYHIETFEQLINVANEENFERLLTDFSVFLIHYLRACKQYREAYKRKSKGKGNYELMKPKFIWIDDGKHEISHVIIVNPENGEHIRMSAEFKDKKPLTP